jgi:hypothetical protein
VRLLTVLTLLAFTLSSYCAFCSAASARECGGAQGAGAMKPKNTIVFGSVRNGGLESAGGWRIIRPGRVAPA